MEEKLNSSDSDLGMNYDYSILIPTWRNLDFLRNCLSSIQSHSVLSPQILVYANEADEDTLTWLKEKNITYLSNYENVGICIAMNALRAKVASDYICYINDDMYVLPGWDREILEIIHTVEEEFMISSTMIEPLHHGSSTSINADFGQDLSHFNEKELLSRFRSFEFKDWSGSAWPPLWLRTTLWDEIGGFSEEFSPGMYSDPDMAMKAWEAGVRYFRGVSASRVYHFGSKSTHRLSISQNKGRNLFLSKWGMTARYFYKYYLRMGKKFSGPLAEPRHPLFGKLINKWKLRKSHTS